MHYLTIQESGDEIYVLCDGYIFNFDLSVDNHQITHTVNGTPLAYVSLYQEDASGTYRLEYDSNETHEIIENTPTRVVIRQTGWLYTSGGASPMGSASNKAIVTYTFYPDRFFVDIEYITDSTTITLNNNQDKNGYTINSGVGLTNVANIRENSGSESAGAVSTDYPTADYIGITSDEVDMIVIPLAYSCQGTAQWQQYFDAAAGELFSGWVDGTLTEGTHRKSYAVIVDSAYRAFPSTFPHTGILDDFNRSNEGPPPSSDWDDDLFLTGLFGQFAVVSNQAIPALENGTAAASWAAILNGNTEVYTTIPSVPDAEAENVAVAVLMEDTYDTVLPTGYILQRGVDDDDELVIVRIDGGDGVIVSDEILVMEDGMSIGLRVGNGVVSSWYKLSAGSWTLLGEANDDTYDGPWKIGITTSDEDTIIDNFGGGDAKKYTSVERLQMGDQYKDLEI